MMDPATIARNLLAFDDYILSAFAISIDKIKSQITIEKLDNSYIVDASPPVDTQNPKKRLIWDIRRQCAFARVPAILDINYALVEAQKALPNLNLSWINYAPLATKGRLLFAPSIVYLSRQSSAIYFLFVPLFLFRDLYTVRSLLSRWNRLNRKTNPPQNAIALFVKNWKPDEAITSIDPIARLYKERSHAAIHLTERDHLVEGIQEIAASHLRIYHFYLSPYKGLPSLRPTTYERYSNVKLTAASLTSDEIRWLRVFEAFHGLPLHLLSWGWHLSYDGNEPMPLHAFRSLKDKGFLSFTAIPSPHAENPLISVNLSERGIAWLSSYDHADLYRTPLYYRFFVRHNHRRYLHLLSSYYALAKLVINVRHAHAMGWHWQLRRAFGEYLASQSYRPEVSSNNIMVYRPDAMAILADEKGNEYPLHFEIDGWRLGMFGVQRSRFFKHHWENRFRGLLTYFYSKEWLMRYNRFPIVFFISENYTQSLAAAQQIVAPILGDMQRYISIYIAPWTAYQSPRHTVYTPIWHAVYNPEQTFSLQDILEQSRSLT